MYLHPDRSLPTLRNTVCYGCRFLEPVRLIWKASCLIGVDKLSDDPLLDRDHFHWWSATHQQEKKIKWCSDELGSKCTIFNAGSRSLPSVICYSSSHLPSWPLVKGWAKPKAKIVDIAPQIVELQKCKINIAKGTTDPMHCNAMNWVLWINQHLKVWS